MGTGEWIAVGGVIVAVLGVGVVLWVHWRERDKCTLDYRIVSNQPIISAQADEARSLFKVTYRHPTTNHNRTLTNPQVVRVRVKNTGRKTVPSGGYDGPGQQPIQIKFETNPPLNAVAADPTQAALVGEIQLDSSSGIASIRPGMLLQGDVFDIQLISDGETGDISVSTRFPEQTRLMRDVSYILPTSKFVRRLRIGAVALGVVSVVALFLGGDFSFFLTISFFGLVAFIVLILILGMREVARERRSRL